MRLIKLPDGTYRIEAITAVELAHVQLMLIEAGWHALQVGQEYTFAGWHSPAPGRDARDELDDQAAVIAEAAGLNDLLRGDPWEHKPHRHP